MKKILVTGFFIVSICAIRAQTPALSDPNIKTTIQKIKDNRDHLFKSFKGEKEPDLGLGLGDSYHTKIKLYGVKGSLADNDFDENMSFRISNAEHKKATKDDFDKAFAELSGLLRSNFSDLEIREKQDEKTKELTLFEKGKDTSAPMADDRSPQYYITLKYTEEAKDFYALFFFVVSKKKK